MTNVQAELPAEAVAAQTLIKGLMVRGTRLDDALTEYAEKHKDSPDRVGLCHNIAVAIILDLHDQGQATDWAWCSGDLPGGVAHSWVEYRGLLRVDMGDLHRLRFTPTSGPKAFLVASDVTMRTPTETVHWVEEWKKSGEAGANAVNPGTIRPPAPAPTSCGLMNDRLFLVEIAEGTSPLDVQNQLDSTFHGRVNVAEVSREVLVRDEVVRRLREFGPTRAIAMVSRLEEAVLKAGVAPTALASLVNAMLRRLSPTPTELFIVDSYFFAQTKKTPPNYADIIDQLWAGVLDSVASLVIVTDPRNDNGKLVTDVRRKASARNRAVQIHHLASTDFHDRFWIVDRTNGLLVGTSANSLGNKYAVADYLQDADVHEIVTELSALGLLPGSLASPARRKRDPQHIALAAYARWLAGGCGDGNDLEDWSEAERFLWLA